MKTSLQSLKFTKNNVCSCGWRQFDQQYSLCNQLIQTFFSVVKMSTSVRVRTFSDIVLPGKWSDFVDNYHISGVEVYGRTEWQYVRGHYIWLLLTLFTCLECILLVCFIIEEHFFVLISLCSLAARDSSCTPPRQWYFVSFGVLGYLATFIQALDTCCYDLSLFLEELMKSRVCTQPLKKYLCVDRVEGNQN